MAKEFLWITKTEENQKFYSDSGTKTGLFLRFASDIDSDTKKSICRFVRFLRKEFYFPIRCNIYFCNQEKFRSSKSGYCYGVFYHNFNEDKRLVYPQIYIPVKNRPLSDVYDGIGHELTHYFQWYFLVDNNKCNRALEIQASKYATRILNDYCGYHCIERDIACERCCKCCGGYPDE